MDSAAPCIIPAAPMPSIVDAGPPPAPKPPPGPPKRIFAKKFVAKVREAPKKEAFRIGYLRGGSVLMAKTGEPIGFEKCRKGWFELETGGFICSTVDAIPFLAQRPTVSPSQGKFIDPLRLAR